MKASFGTNVSTTSSCKGCLQEMCRAGSEYICATYLPCLMSMTFSSTIWGRTKLPAVDASAKERRQSSSAQTSHAYCMASSCCNTLSESDWTISISRSTNHIFQIYALRELNILTDDRRVKVADMSVHV